ncbi:conditioned medium-induced protein 4 [Halovivax gelatinilyticus]|uniref:conditioned medium-induced protein 4 n=1 Tax=Halovivax gelatinilyticus TaxID=2961597 RepID=UPI0020CA90AC|nr:conditioned medium-induced protein 4 [Halovivax gelatinilyticus]
MDEKTEELREIFTSVTDEETVTESQEAGRGSLEKDDRTIEERVAGVVGQMRERYAFDTALTDEELVSVVHRFYEDESDGAIAADLGVAEDEIFEARMALHLVRSAELPDLDLVTLREREDGDEMLADEFDVTVEEIRRYRELARAQAESRAANDRYRDEFESLLSDSDLTSRMAADVREDGLEDATEGMETDVSF